MFDPLSIDLPIRDIIAEVKEQLSVKNSLIVHAPPGAGKSTLLPLALLHESWLQNQKILMLEPRRLAARSIANRMASLLGEKVGETVGYRIRFEQAVSEKTRIEVLTEGILTRMIHSDRELEGIAMVIFDEFHERSIYADVALALFRETQLVLRPELRMMVMSATLDIPKLQEILQAPIAESLGKQFPVAIHYVGQQDRQMMPELTARVVMKAVKEHDGDVLVFLPGQFEITKCEEILRKSLRSFMILPLYGMLPQAKQLQAIFPDKKGRRKIVLATSIAETSLTIEGVKIVVDSGFGRTSVFDPNSGLSRLETVTISKDSADQRAGRAGRLSAGVCYRMWSRSQQDQMDSHRTPEILEADLSFLVLDLAQWGINDASTLSWITQPPKGKLLQARETLTQLEALKNGAITDHGRKMHALPCHPRIAHMLLRAAEDEQVDVAADIAAILEERDPLPKESGIDLSLRVEALRKYRAESRTGGRMRQIERISASYRKLFDVATNNDPVDPFEIGILIASAYPERIAHARPGNNAQFQLANGRLAMAGHKDDLAHESWLAVATIDARQGMGKIFMASQLDPRDLAPMVKKTETITWDTRKGGLIATEDLRIGNIILQSSPLPDPDEKHLIKAMSDAIKKEGEHLLPFSKAVNHWQNRVLSLRKWRPEEGWPDVGTDNLLLTNEDWLLPYLHNVKTLEDLKKLDLVEILTYSLPQRYRESLAHLAPDHICVPSGSKIAVQYFPDAAPPVLAVRLQEVFGMVETPRVNEQQTAVLMHLLSPGFKPVQITSDLKSFWSSAYFEVRKELKRRYPKHAWPENPMEGKPENK